MSVEHHNINPIPRHRIGHRSRVQDLNRRVKASAHSLGDSSGDPTDPLSGNYTLVRLEDIVVAYLGLNEAVTLQAFPVSAADGTKTPPTLASLAEGVTQAYPLLGGASPQRPLSLVTGDFNGDGQDEAALAFFTDTSLNLATLSYNESSATFAGVAPAATPFALASPTSQGTVRLAAGLLDPAQIAKTEPIAQLVVALPKGDGTLTVALWDLSSTTPTLLASDNSINLTGAFDIAIADVDGDGVEELGVAWQGQADANGNTLFLKVFKWGAPGITPPQNLTTLASVGAGQIAGGFVSLAGGTMNPDVPGYDQLALGWGAPPAANSKATGTPSLTIWSFVPATNQTPAQLTAGNSWNDASEYPLVDVGILRVAVGDVNEDGVDEVILGSQGTYTQGQTSAPDILVLRCFTVDGTSTLTLTSTGFAGAEPGQSLVSVDLSLAIGAPTPPGANDALLNSIVVGCVGSDTLQHVLEGIGMVTVAVIQMAGSLTFPPALTTGLAILNQNETSSNGIPAVCFDGAQGSDLSQIQISLALGDFSGRSIRVGPPTYFRVESTQGVIAIINAPPSQYVSEGQEPMNTFANFSQNNEQETSLQLNVNRDWTTSDTLNANLSLQALGEIGTSINNSYGVGFSNSTEAIQSLTTGLSAQAQYDDIILFSVTDYDIWEYPVYQGATETPAGHILVVFPDIPPNQAPEIDVQAGLKLNSYYAPSHQVLQLMSYPLDGSYPPDYLSAQALFSGNWQGTNTNNMTIWNITWSKVSSTETSTSSKISLDVSNSASVNISPSFLEGLGLGINIAVNDAYTQNTISTHEVEYVETTSIMIQCGQLSDEMYQYSVEPLLYWSAYGNYLVLDYSVTVDTHDTYWNSTYSDAMPMLSLPWNTTYYPYSTEAVLQLLTRSINPTVDAQGNVCIQATILNYGLQEASGLTATFYQADPSTIVSSGIPSGAVQIGQPQSVPPIAASGQATVAIAWTPPEANANYALYCAVGAPGAPPSVIGYNMYPPNYFTVTSGA